MARLGPMAASCSGDHPALFRQPAINWRPPSRCSTLTTSACPLAAAMCSAVLPFRSAALTSKALLAAVLLPSSGPRRLAMLTGGGWAKDESEFEEVLAEARRGVEVHLVEQARAVVAKPRAPAGQGEARVIPSADLQHVVQLHVRDRRRRV